MTIIRHLTQKPSLERIELEEDIVKLLQDVKADISFLDRDFSSKNLRDILAIIQEGFYEIPRENGNHYTDFVDLHEAQRLVTDYQLHSEGGCQSCRHYKF